MSFFAKGDFKLQASWEQKQQKPPTRTSNSRNKSRDLEKNKSLVTAGKNIIAQPTTDILDDQLSKRILKDFAEEHSIGSAKVQKKTFKDEQSVKMPPRQKPNHSEGDLLTSMAARLKSVEMTCKSQREEIREKAQLIEKLKAENAFLKGVKEDSGIQFQKVQAIESQNQELKKKIVEMEEYLKKYGLKWVGNKPEGQLQHDKMKKDIKQHYQYRLPKQIDINTILRRVQELNSGLHSEGMGTEVYQENGVHKFRQAQPLPLGFFSNGIAIKGYKFFPYNSKQAGQILGDLVDGYFPYVLKGKYPNGVFMKVVDKVAEQYIEQSSEENVNTFQSNQNKEFKPPSKEQFLNRLPEQVIKNGKVIKIRGEIEKRLNGEGDPRSEAEVEENGIQTREEGGAVFKTDENRKIRSKLINEGDICTIKIRNQVGEVYILQLDRSHKIQQVYFWMEKVSRQNFSLMSNFPRRSFSRNEEESLEQLGLYPNAMLHLHLIQ